jgi:glutaminyl-peptide cyclotransferase
LGPRIILWSGLLLLSICRCHSPSLPSFDKDRAFVILKEQCDFGPRHPGTEGHRKVRQYLLDKLSQYTDLVKTQEFVLPNPLGGEELELTNIIASFYPRKSKRLLLGAHWDTRPIADRDPDTTLRTQPVPGGNDGASGVAVLLEMARIISQHEPPWGVDMVLFDGEDGGREEDLVGFCLGSDYFASNIGNYKPEFGIVVDMIGDRDLKLYREGHSQSYALELTDLIWSKAKDLGYSCFNDSVGYFIYDDHVPLQEAGIPAVDLIDLDYPYWHTTSDTPDKCSPESLKKIGDVLIAVLYGDD